MFIDTKFSFFLLLPTQSLLPSSLSPPSYPHLSPPPSMLLWPLQTDIGNAWEPGVKLPACTEKTVSAYDEIVLCSSSHFSCWHSKLVGTGDLRGTVESAFKSIIGGKKGNYKDHCRLWILVSVDKAVEAAINSGYRCETQLWASFMSTMIQWIRLEGGPRGPLHSLKSCF